VKQTSINQGESRQTSMSPKIVKQTSMDQGESRQTSMDSNELKQTTMNQSEVKKTIIGSGAMRQTMMKQMTMRHFLARLNGNGQPIIRQDRFYMNGSWLNETGLLGNRMAGTLIIGIMLAGIILTASGCGAEKPLILGGTVEAETSDIVTEVGGRIDTLFVEEGQHLTKGAIVAVLDSSIQLLTVKQLEQAVEAKEAKVTELLGGNRTEQIEQARFAHEAAKAQYDEVKNGPSDEQLKMTEAQVAVAQAAVDSAKVLVDYTEQIFRDAEVLKKAEDISDTAYEEAIYHRDAAQAGLKTAQQQLSSAKAQQDEVKKGSHEEAITAAKAREEQAHAQLILMENGAADSTINIAVADLEQSKLALAQGNLVLDKYILKAPCDGVITLLSVNRGEVVNSGAAIGTISDLKDLTVRLYIPQKNLDAISLGKELSLKATSLPGKTIPAVITWISDAAEFTPRNTETTASKESTVFRFKLSVQGQETGLKPGMSLEAEIPGAVSEQ